MVSVDCNELKPLRLVPRNILKQRRFDYIIFVMGGDDCRRILIFSDPT